MLRRSLLSTALLLGSSACGGPTREAAPAAPGPSPVDSTAFRAPGAPPDASPPGPPATDLAAYCRASKDHPILGDQAYRRAAAELATLGGIDPAGAGVDAATRKHLADLHFELGRQLLSLGRAEEAIPELDQALALLPALGLAPDVTVRGLVGRALAQLRIADNQNCNVRDYPYVCLLFTGAAGAYRRPEHLRAAVTDLEAALVLAPEDLRALWLLNVAHMLLGDWPAGVPDAYRIPEARFKSAHAAPRFRNVARDLAVDGLSLLGGAVIEDLDGDGNLDIVTTSYDPCVPVTFYRNQGDGRFADYTAASGLSAITGGFNAVQTDYDNDGRMDLFITRGGWQADAGRMRPSLLHQAADGRFEDRAVTAGLAEAVYPTQVSAWADYDGDGDLDLYIGNEIGNDGKPYPSQLFRNNGDGSFADVAPAAGVTDDLQAKGAAWGDYDNDGDPDLYVSNIGANRLYRNNGDGTFTDLAPGLGVTEPTGRSFATWFFDYDNDGWLDLFVAGYFATVADVAADVLGRETKAITPRLYHNRQGRFEDVTQAAGLTHAWLPMGANFGDIDNDGFPDIFLGTGDPDFQTLVPDIMLWNDGAGHFVDVTEASATGHLPKGHGVAFGDLDNDGDQDLYLESGGFYPGDKSPNALFENPGGRGHWLNIQLIGARSNRAAIGARLRVVVEEGGRERSVHAVVDSGGSFGANSLRQEMGLGGASRIKQIEVSWPTTGLQQVFKDPPLDSFLQVREDSAAFTLLTRPRIELFHLPEAR